MRLGIHHSSIGIVPWDEAVRQAADVGSEGVMLGFYSRIDMQSVPIDVQARMWRALAGTHHIDLAGLYLRCLTAFPAMIGPAASQREGKRIVCEAIDMAESLRASTVVVPFLGRNKIESASNFERAIASLTDLREAAESAGVVLAVEAGISPSRMEYMLDQVGSEFVKACVDTATLSAARYDPAVVIRALGAQRIGLVLLRDVYLANSVAPQYGLDLGHGEVDFQAVGEALRAVGYDGWAIIRSAPGDRAGEIARANIHFASAMLEGRVSLAHTSADFLPTRLMHGQ